MRASILLALAAFVSSAVSLTQGAPEGALCPSLPVQLELRQSPTMRNKYQLVFAAIDPNLHMEREAQFVDIHYRINNENSINERVVTQDASTQSNVPAKQAQVDGIELQPGDALRAYATYMAKGYACDTPIHTFNAPEPQADQFEAQQMYPMGAGFETQQMMPRFVRSARSNMYRAARGIEQGSRSFDIAQMRRPMEQSRRRSQIEEESYFTQAAEDNELLQCSSIPLEQDVVKIAGMDNTYMLTFENRNPKNQLHYVDLHLSTDAANGWDNLRLASDMQLQLAHKVMQPGVVVKPSEVLKWYWSYRTETKDGQIVDCTTEVHAIRPRDITHEITLKELNNAARA